MNIAFKDHEFRMETDLSTGALTVLIPVETVRARLSGAQIEVPEKPAQPKPAGAAKPGLTRSQVLDRFSTTLEGVGWSRWLELNERQTKSGKRSPAKLEKIRVELEALAAEYNPIRLGSAMGRCREPKHANIAYVKTILKNDDRGDHGRDKGGHDEFNEQLDTALSNIG